MTTNRADPGQLALVYIYTCCNVKAYPGSAGPGLIFSVFA